MLDVICSMFTLNWQWTVLASRGPAGPPMLQNLNGNCCLWYFRQRRRYMFLPVFVRLSVCLSVSKITEKCVHAFGWNVACRQMSGHGRSDWLLSPIRIIVRMPEPDSFLRYRIGYGTLQLCVDCQRVALLCGILKWFYSLSRRKTFVRGKCALPSALLVWICQRLVLTVVTWLIRYCLLTMQ